VTVYISSTHSCFSNYTAVTPAGKIADCLCLAILLLYWQCGNHHYHIGYVVSRGLIVGPRH